MSAAHLDLRWSACDADAVFLGVLGGLVVRAAEGEEIRLGGALPRRALAALLIADGRPVTADALTDVLWEGEPPSSATSSLHSTVSRLRRALALGGPGATLRLTPAGYQLDVDPDDVDARRFARLAREGRALVASDPRAALERLREADRLWRGPALAEFADREFARAMAARLEELRVDAHEDAVEAQLALGAGADLLDPLAELTRAHPLRERLRGHHALALYRAGRQAEALAVVADARDMLREELGLDPGRELRQLEARMLRHDPALTVTRAPDVQERVRSGERHLVGRQGEVALLQAMLTEVTSGEVRFAVLEGEAGIGKTRLLEEVASLASAAGVKSVWGRCGDGEVAPAYWPWLEVLRTLHADGALASVPPEFAALLDPVDAQDHEPTNAARFRLFEVVTAALVTAARSAPLVVLVEDLQWADAASAELLNHLAVRLHGVPVAVVASLRELEIGRDDAITGAVATVVRRAGTRRLMLHPVPASASAALIRGVVGVDVSLDAAVSVHRRAQGNPFFMGELSRLLHDTGRLEDPGAAADAEVPHAVRDVVRRRLAGLPSATRGVVEASAVLGGEAELAVLAETTGRGLDECIDAVEPALASRVLVTVPEVPGRVRFAHALVRESALAEVSTLRRARLHARVADALVSVHGDGEDIAELLASHLWQAAGVVGPSRAAAALERGAEVAIRRTAYESADDLLSRAVELRRSAGSSATAQEAELVATVRLVTLRRSWKGYSHAYQTLSLERAEGLARRSGRTDLYLGLLFAHFSVAATSGDVATAQELAGRMRDHAKGHLDPVVRVLGQTVWAITCWHLGRMTEADRLVASVQQAVAELSQDDATRLADIDSTSLLPCFALHIRVLAGSLEPDGHFEQLRERFTNPYDQVVIGNFAAMTAVLCGDDATASTWAQWALDHDTEGQFHFFGGPCEAHLGWAEARHGRPVAGLQRIDHGLARYAGAGGRTGFGYMAAARVEAMLLAGSPLEHVAGYLEDSEAQVRGQGERFVVPYLSLARARLAAARGADVDAETHLRAAVETAEEMGIAPVRRLAAQLRSTLPRGAHLRPADRT
jgi:DNA-binding SARP family transcriptional activator